MVTTTTVEHISTNNGDRGGKPNMLTVASTHSEKDVCPSTHAEGHSLPTFIFGDKTTEGYFHDCFSRVF